MSNKEIKNENKPYNLEQEVAKDARKHLLFALGITVATYGLATYLAAHQPNRVINSREIYNRPQAEYTIEDMRTR